MGDRDVYAEAGEVSCDEAREIARRYNASHFRNYRDCGEEARYSIPVDPRRDDDIRLEAFIRRAEVAFKRLADAERKLQPGEVLKFVAIDYAAFSPDNRGSYRISHVIDEWVAEYIERGEEVESVLSSKSFDACVDACERHAKERSDD